MLQYEHEIHNRNITGENRHIFKKILIFTSNIIKLLMH